MHQPRYLTKSTVVLLAMTASVAIWLLLWQSDRQRESEDRRLYMLESKERWLEEELGPQYAEQVRGSNGGMLISPAEQVELAHLRSRQKTAPAPRISTTPAFDKPPPE